MREWLVFVVGVGTGGGCGEGAANTGGGGKVLCSIFSEKNMEEETRQ
jgi:hypothetical protein